MLMEYVKSLAPRALIAAGALAFLSGTAYPQHIGGRNSVRTYAPAHTVIIIPDKTDIYRGNVIHEDRLKGTSKAVPYNLNPYVNANKAKENLQLLVNRHTPVTIRKR